MNLTNYLKRLFHPNSRIQYHIDLCNEAGTSLHSIIFMTHNPEPTTSNKTNVDLGGHWVAIEHEVQLGHIWIWDSLEGENYTLLFSSVDSELIAQWVFTNMVRSNSESLVSCVHFHLKKCSLPICDPLWRIWSFLAFLTSFWEGKS